MDCNATRISYRQTGYFSSIVNAYLKKDPKLDPFYRHPVSMKGIADAMEETNKFPRDREMLVSELTLQYKDLPVSKQVEKNISLLSSENTFTVCTAHQPAIFTGTLFFIYKILHAAKLAAELTQEFPGKHFVPVYYMGSEDADLDELGHIFLHGDKLAWDTKQKGAIGRMHTKGLEKIIARIEGELSVLPFGAELVTLLQECYLKEKTIQQATLHLVHQLLGSYGVVVIIPDNRRFKEMLKPVFEDELLNQSSSRLVEQTMEQLNRDFKVQAHPRAINLFYLKDDIRERIEHSPAGFSVVNTSISFSADEMKKELEDHPERFSPNVILRGIMQERLLPNVAFIGGGGELAYWMELKQVFEHFKTPYPVLVLRNSFLIMESVRKEKLEALGFETNDIFRAEEELFGELVSRESEKQLTLADEISKASDYYSHLRILAQKVDTTLSSHVAALETRAIKPLQELEKKMLRAEKRRYDVQKIQLKKIKSVLFPNNNLQERVENFMPYYAKWGDELFRKIYEHSPGLEQEFTVLSVK